MRIMLAVAAFAIAAIPLGFVSVGVISGLVELGAAETMATIFCDWYNTSVTCGCVLLGAIFTVAGTSLIYARPDANI
jgi:hypothetical protein